MRPPPEERFARIQIWEDWEHEPKGLRSRFFDRNGLEIKVGSRVTDSGGQVGTVTLACVERNENGNPVVCFQIDGNRSILWNVWVVP